MTLRIRHCWKETLVENSFSAQGANSFRQSYPTSISDSSLSLHGSNRPLPLIHLIEHPTIRQAVASTLRHSSLIILYTRPNLNTRYISQLIKASCISTKLRAVHIGLGIGSTSTVYQHVDGSIAEVIRVSRKLNSRPSKLLILSKFGVISRKVTTHTTGRVTNTVLTNIRILILVSPSYSCLISCLPRYHVFKTHSLMLANSRVHG